MNTVVPFPLVGLGSIAPSPADLQPRAQARMRMALRFTAVWRPPSAGSRANAKLAIRFNARGRSRAAVKLALRFNARWVAPPAPAKARAKIALRFNAASPAVQLWPNGFVGQIELRMPPIGGGITVANALLPLIITNPALRTEANLGLSKNAGLDVQITSGATVLGYVRLGYSATTGLWAGLVNIPSRAFASAESLMIYVGKASTDGQDATLARGADWLAWFGGGSGTDLTGQSRDLTAHGTPATSTLDLLPAWDFDGVDDYLDQVSSTYLNGLTAITAVQVYDTAVQNEIRELWNVSVGTSGELAFRLTGANAQLTASARFGASFLSLVSANATVALAKQASAVLWAAGETPQLWTDGIKNVLTQTPGNPAGTLSISDTLELGRGARGSLLYWHGRCSFLGFSSRRQPEAVLQTVTAAFADPQRVYGHGTANKKVDAVASPVALPAYGTAEPGQASAAIDVAAASYDPGGLALTCTAATVSSGNGGASISGTRVTITPDSDTSDGDTVLADYTIRNSSLKTSSSRLYVTVSASSTSPDRPETPPVATTTRLVPEDGSLSAVYNLANDGDHISIADGSYGGFTFDRSFTPSRPVVIKARNLNGAVFTGRMLFPATSRGHWLYQIKNTQNNATGNDARSGAIDVQGSYFTMTKCWLTGRMGITMGNESEVHHCWIGWNRFTGHSAGNGGSSHIYLSLPEGNGNWTQQSDGPHHIYIYRNFMWDNDTSGEDHYLYFGNAKVFGNIGKVPECYVEYNLIYHVSGNQHRARGFYMKRGCVFRYNDDMAPGAGSNGFRHSRGGEMYGNTIRQDILNVNGGSSSEFTVMYANAVGQKIRLWSAGNSSSGGNVPHQAADYCELAGNRKYGGGTLQVDIGVAQGVTSDGTGFDGGVVDHVRVWDGGFQHNITRAGSQWCDQSTCDGTARSGWGAYDSTVTPITLTPIQVGQKLSDQR